jgi:ADP-heptose:LPS heptosyltransferase
VSDSFIKKTELSLKKGINKFLFSGAQPELLSVPMKLFDDTKIKRILLLRQDRIGDVLVSTGFLRNLRKAMKNSEIDILLSNKNIGARRAVDPWVDNVVEFRKGINQSIKLIGQLKKRKYDLVIDLFDNASTTSSILLKNLSSKYKLGFEKENSGNYTHTVPLPDKREIHIVDRIANLLLPFGLAPNELDLRLNYKLSDIDKKFAMEKIPKSNKKILGINLAGSSRAKYWGTTNNIDFLQKIDDQDLEIIIFSMPDYKDELDEICSKTKAKPAPAASGVHEYACLLSRCDYILTTDTSAVHFASALNIPQIGLYTEGHDPAAPLPWMAYKTKSRSIISVSEELSDIDPVQVHRAFLELCK